jgi:hypothetical protein
MLWLRAFPLPTCQAEHRRARRPYEPPRLESKRIDLTKPTNFERP